MEKELNSLQDTKQFAKEFLAEVRGPASYQDDKVVRNVILLQGELGAGKTTFSQFLLEAIGAEGPFTSPTFVIMKKYELQDTVEDTVENTIKNITADTANNTTTQSHNYTTTYSSVKNVYHLDCYRVEEESVLDLGWEEIIADQNNLILVEWPEKIKNIWPEKYWLLKFEYGKSKGGRIVKIIKK